MIVDQERCAQNVTIEVPISLYRKFYKFPSSGYYARQTTRLLTLITSISAIFSTTTLLLLPFLSSTIEILLCYSILFFSLPFFFGCFFRALLNRFLSKIYFIYECIRSLFTRDVDRSPDSRVNSYGYSNYQGILERSDMEWSGQRCSPQFVNFLRRNFVSL